MKMIDKTNNIPLYQQIKEALQEAIETREYPEGSRLPAEHQICKMYAVSRITVVRAFDLLEQENYIYRVQGKGSFVSTKTVERDMTNLKSFTALLREQGYNPSNEVISKEFIKATQRLNRQFGRTEDSKEDYVRIKRIRYVDNIPIGINTSITQLNFSAELSLEELKGSIYQLLEKKYGSQFYRADESLSVTLAGEEESALLEIPKGFPMFKTEGTTYDAKGNPIELSCSLFRGDKVRYRTQSLNLNLVFEGLTAGTNEENKSRGGG